MDGQGGGVQSVTFLPDNRRLMTSSNQTNEVILWDVTTGKKLWTTPAETFSMAVSPDGKLLAFRKDHEIQIWDIDKREKRCSLMPQEFGIGHFSFAFSPDGKYFGAAELGGDIVIWDVKSSALLCDYNGPIGDGLCIEASPKGKYFYVGGYRNSTVCRWPIPTEK
jgi:WD40 repeat protein